MCNVIAVSTLFGLGDSEMTKTKKAPPSRSLHSSREIDHILDKEITYFILVISAKKVMQRKGDMKSWKRWREIRVTFYIGKSTKINK